MTEALRYFLTTDKTTRWVGWGGMDRLLSPQELAALGLPRQIVPVDLTTQAYDAYYGNFANGSLWPVFHGFTPRRMYTKTDWQAALTVTEQFADKIMSITKPEDVIWIHDFHLVMLPKALRERGVKNRIGFFLHIPFPEIQHLQTLPNYGDMLASLSMADLAGFQTDADMLRYRTAQKRFGAHNAKQHVAVFPVGIDYALYSTAYKSEGVRMYQQMIDKAVGDRTLILSVSRLDYTKGILEQLEAVEQFLLHVADPARYLYKLIVAPSREMLEEYQTIRRKIEAKVKAINARFVRSGWQPIDYEHRGVQFDELAAWYERADIMLVAPLIDGMNLVAKEYIAAKAKRDGVLIISRTAGAARQLVDALQVDARDVTDIVRALREAIAMPSAERQRRHTAMRQMVREEDAAKWGKRFTAALVANPS